METHDPQLTKKTAFLSNYLPEQVFLELSDYLKNCDVSFKISNKTWKLTYTVSRDIEETKDAQQAIVESAKI